MLKNILSISGKPGLYKMLNEGKGSLIVESLLDGKKMPVFGHYKVVSLQDVAIYTDEEEVPLWKVLATIKEKFNGEKVMLTKSSNEELKKFFEDILPDYDRDRVYVSDIKKLVTWYNVLVEKGITDFESDEEQSE